jgi:hypothetical protein
MFTFKEKEACNMLDRSLIATELSQLMTIRNAWERRNGRDNVVIAIENAIVPLAKLQGKQLVFA